MPIATTSINLILAAAFLPIMGAMAAVTTPGEREVYTLVGATVAVLLGVAYLRLKAPHVGFYALAFSVIATASIGWILPESVVWALAHAGWIADVTVETMSRKVWALMGLVFGLSGNTLIVVILTVVQKRLPVVADMLVDTWVPGSGGKPPMRVTVEAVTPGAKALKDDAPLLP